MKKLKLYKFRSLADESFEWTKLIIENGEFYCSPLWEQNDPMEGVYSYLRADERSTYSIDILSEKNRYKICSFSGDEAFKDPKMWGYYANGFKGLAIEIEIEIDKVEKIEYVYELELIKSDLSNLINIITTKLKAWKHENEYRFLYDGESGSRKIGEITGVYFGNPYGNTDNQLEIIKKSEKLSDYFSRRQKLIDLSKHKDLPCYTTIISFNKDKAVVTFKPIT